MTGKDLIIYILKNDLEDKPVFENGKLLGFMSLTEAAIKLDVGVATIRAWCDLKMIEYFNFGGIIYIPADVTVPTEKPDYVMNGVEYYVR